MTPLFIGSGVAIVTPFNEDQTVNYELFEKLTEFQIANNTDAVVVCGTTGEGSTLTVAERAELFARAAAKSKGRVPIICSTGSNSTSFCLETAKTAEKCGADAHLMITPYYNKTSQAGLLEHYFTLAEELTKPIILYNVPSRTGMNIQPETYAALSKHPRIVAVKEADPDLSKMIRSMALCDGNLTFYSGNDDLAVPACLLGAKGTISVLANLIPRYSHDMNRLAVDGIAAKSARMQRSIHDLNDALFSDVNPIPVKYAMQKLGVSVGRCRLPLTEPSEKAKQAIDLAIQTHDLQQIIV